jgi:hypothetical protein
MPRIQNTHLRPSKSGPRAKRPLAHALTAAFLSISIAAAVPAAVSAEDPSTTIGSHMDLTTMQPIVSSTGTMESTKVARGETFSVSPQKHIFRMVPLC